MATNIQINFNNALPFRGFFLMMRHFKSWGFTKAESLSLVHPEKRELRTLRALRTLPLTLTLSERRGNLKLRKLKL
jgi:hypothetical protein